MHLPELLHVLRFALGAGYLSAEIFPLPTPEAAAAQTIQSFRHLLPR